MKKDMINKIYKKNLCKTQMITQIIDTHEGIPMVKNTSRHKCRDTKKIM